MMEVRRLGVPIPGSGTRLVGKLKIQMYKENRKRGRERMVPRKGCLSRAVLGMHRVVEEVNQEMVLGSK